MLLKICLIAVLTVACGSGQSGDKPVRSPSQDYSKEPVTTSDGEVVGADGVSPEDKLAEGAKVGGSTEDPSPEVKPAPGWSADDKKGLKHDPKRRTGGNVSEPDAKGDQAEEETDEEQTEQTP